MKKMGKNMLTLMMMALNILLVTGCKSTLKNSSPIITIENIEQISKIQIHAHRMDKTEYPSNKFENLIKDLENAIPLGDTEAKKVPVNDNKMYISFIYENGEKNIFSFFKWDRKWYLEHNGNLYSNVDFIINYIGKESYDSLYKDKDEILSTNSEFSITIPLEYLEQFLKASNNSEQMNMKNYFLFSVEYMQNQGYSKEDAISEEKARLVKKWKLYKEAERLDITPSDDEFDKFMQQWISRLSNANNVKDYEPLLAEYHTSWEDIIVKNKNILYYLDITNQLYYFKLYRLKYDEFAAGNDTIKDTIYDNPNDYYNAYLENEVYSYKLVDDESKQFLDELTQAELDLQQ